MLMDDAAIKANKAKKKHDKRHMLLAPDQQFTATVENLTRRKPNVAYVKRFLLNIPLAVESSAEI
jgi:hypothetical protein